MPTPQSVLDRDLALSTTDRLFGALRRAPRSPRRQPDLMDSFLEEAAAMADAVAARRRSPERIVLSFDAWNVWYRTRPARAARPARLAVAPPLLEQVDHGAGVALLEHACLAQLLNVIAPIMTATGGPAWRQTILCPSPG